MWNPLERKTGDYVDDLGFVDCTNCGIRTEGRASKAVAFAAWNRRAPRDAALMADLNSIGDTIPAHRAIAQRAVAALASMSTRYEDRCPVCAVPFKPDDMCLTDIVMGICHAECLRGSPMVDLDTGEPMPEWSPPPEPYRYDEDTKSAPPPSKVKALHWTDRRVFGSRKICGISPFGEWCSIMVDELSDTGIEMLKAKHQASYEARILSTLEPATVTEMHDDSAPLLAQLKLVINDGYLPDHTRRVARSAYDALYTPPKSKTGDADGQPAR